MSEYAINVDWTEERKNPDKWINHGRDALVNNCKHKTRDKDSNIKNRENNLRYGGYCDECGVSEDDAEPMMNYIYPLSIEPDEDNILKVVKNTAMTIMENTETGEWFLALCGGGMDFSQDIALAYNIAQRWIPEALALSVSTQYGLTKSGKEWLQMMNALKESLENAQGQIKEKLARIDEALKKHKKAQ